MPSIETCISQAIRARVATISLPYPVIWTDGEPVAVPASGGQPVPFIEAHHEPNRNARPFIGSKDASERRGILLLTLCWPIAKVGTGSGKTHKDAIREMAASNIAGHFFTDVSMTFQGIRVRVMKVPDVLGSYRDDAYLRTQVSIQLETQR